MNPMPSTRRRELPLALLLQREREAERWRLARELHDELGQHLAAIHLGLAPLFGGPSEGHARHLAAMVEQAIASLSRIVRDALPAVLEHRGPTAALRALGREYTHRMGLDVRVRAHGAPEPVPPPVALALYRIVQECLTNVVRHARATRAQVRLRWEPSAVTVVIEDDGVGLPAGGVAPLHGFGLRGLDARVAELRGEFALGARRGGGTRVVARLPLPPFNPPAPAASA